LEVIGLSIVSDPTIIGGAATKAAKPLAKKAISTIVKAKVKPSDVVAKIGQELTSVDREVLKKYSTKEGREELREAYGKQADIGDELVNYIDKFDDVTPEGKAVKAIVKDMDPINITPIITRLQRVKIRNPVAKDKTVNKHLDEIIEDIKKMGDKTKKFEFAETGAKTPPDYGNLDPTRFRKLRIKLDKLISWEDPAKEGLDKALAKTRKGLASELIRAAKKSGNPEYVQIMKDYAKKLQVRDRVQHMLGKAGQTSEERAEGFVSNLMSMNKTRKRQILEELDKLTGSSFMKRIKSTSQAKQIGTPEMEKLEVPWLPKFQTGAKWFGFTGVGSPFIVSRAVIPILRGTEKGSLVALKASVKTLEETGSSTAVKKVFDRLSRGEKDKLEKLAKAYDKDPKPKFKKAILILLNKTEKSNARNGNR